MKSWTTRFTFARWWTPPLSARLGLSAASASNPSMPRRCAIATPPSPPPKRQRNSRRDDCVFGVILFSGMGVSPMHSEEHGRDAHATVDSIHEHELVAVQHQAADVGHAVFVRVGGQIVQLIGLRLAGEDELK